jgi:hypothetical protein
MSERTLGIVTLSAVAILSLVLIFWDTATGIHWWVFDKGLSW